MIKNFRHSGVSQNPYIMNHGFRIALRLSGMTVLFFMLALPLKAEEKKEETPPAPAGRYAPDFCDFEITFPEAPFVAKKCVTENKCYDVQSYTMVYDLSTTVDITVTCNPTTKDEYKKYTEPVMRAALSGMVAERDLTDHEIKFTNTEKTRTATIVGNGKTGAQSKMYIGQLWVGEHSVLTVQGELVGAKHDVADKSFGDILGSVKVKPVIAKAP